MPFVIPLCGPHFCGCGCGLVMNGCHAAHDGRFNEFGADIWTRAELRSWDVTQIAAHRGRFEARNVTNEVIPF